MKTIAEWVSQYSNERRIPSMLGIDKMLEQGIRASTFAAAFMHIGSDLISSDELNADIALELNGESILTLFDWAHIRPLFVLYCEHQEALMLEATRTMGVDVFGRSVDGILNEISVYEADFPRKTFMRDSFSI